MSCYPLFPLCPGSIPTDFPPRSLEILALPASGPNPKASTIPAIANSQLLHLDSLSWYHRWVDSPITTHPVSSVTRDKEWFWEQGAHSAQCLWEPEGMAPRSCSSPMVGRSQRPATNHIFNKPYQHLLDIRVCSRCFEKLLICLIIIITSFITEDTKGWVGSCLMSHS